MFISLLGQNLHERGLRTPSSAIRTKTNIYIRALLETLTRGKNMLLDTASRKKWSDEIKNTIDSRNMPLKETKISTCTPECCKDAEDVFFKWRTCSSTGTVRISNQISRYCTKVARIHHPWPAPTHKKFQIKCWADLQSGKTKSWALDFRVKKKNFFSAA